MTIRHLKVFVTVCELNSITKAAEKLHIAQPSVTQTIKELEKYYDVTLFERINQRLVLTELGETALVRANEVISAFEGFEGLMNQLKTSVVLHIGASITLGQTRLPSLLKRIQESYPEVECTAMIRQTHIIEKRIEDGRLDFAIVEGKITSSKLTAIPFDSDTLVAVAGGGYEVGDKIKINDLNAHRMLLREPGSASRDLFDHIAGEHGIAVHPEIESASNEALISAAEMGLGIAVLPISVAEKHTSKKLKRIEIESANFSRDFYLIYRKSKKFSRLQKDIMKLFIASYKEMGENFK